MEVKEESEKVGLKLNIQKMKIMASGPITSWEIDGETVADFIFLLKGTTKLWNPLKLFLRDDTEQSDSTVIGTGEK